MNVGAAALSVTVALLCGFAGARYFVGPGKGGPERVLAVAVGALLALGASGVGYAAHLVLHLPWAVPLAVLALLSAAGLRAQPGALGGPGWHDPYPQRLQGALWAISLLALAVFVGLLLEHHYRWPEGGYDAWAIWNSRARFLARGGEATAFWPGNVQADYPFLVPSIVAQGFVLASGGQGEPFAVPGVVAGAFAILTALLLFGVVSRLRGVTTGAVAVGLLVTVPGFFYYAWAQYMDEAEGAFLLAACAALVLALRAPPGDRARLLSMAGLSGGLAAWCKNDGALHLCALGAALLLPRRTPELLARRLRDLAAFAAGAAPLVLLLAVYKLRLAPPNVLVSGQGAQSLARALNGGRYLQIIRYFAGTVIDFETWALTLAAMLIGSALVWRARPHGAPVRALGAVLGLSLLGIFAVYLLTPFELGWHLDTSANRLLLQLLPAALLWLALGLGPGAATPDPLLAVDKTGEAGV